VNKNGNNTALPNIYPQITLNPHIQKNIVFQVSNSTPPKEKKKPPSSCNKTN
jgi:hypothetical protein